MIYLDNAASAPVEPAAMNTALPFMTECCANPSSILHAEGRKAALAIIKARKQCTDAINAKEDEIVFTSGGTESNNLALRGAAELMAKTGKRHIITTSIEHPSVLNTCKMLEMDGFEITYLPVSKSGILSSKAVENALRPDTALVSVMTANNEIGTLQPISSIGKLCRKHGVLFHTDAVQAVGQVELDVKKQNIDLLTCSAHKLGGLKGSGFLYIRKGLDLAPLLYGGGQEQGIRSGTENTAGIVALGAAITIAYSDIKAKQKQLSELRDLLISLLLEIPDSRLNGSPTQRLCSNVNVSFGEVEGESLVLNLDLAEICCSSGSACASGSSEPSYVLKAISTPPKYLNGSLRLTLSHHNTEEEIRTAAAAVADSVKRLRELTHP